MLLESCSRRNPARQEDVSLPVSAAICSYARVTISGYINLPDNPLLYSDTDSVFLSAPLPLEMVSSPGKPVMGTLKSEGHWKDLAILAPKQYAYRDAETGKEVLKLAGSPSEGLSHTMFVKAINTQHEPDAGLTLTAPKWQPYWARKGYVEISEDQVHLYPNSPWGQEHQPQTNEIVRSFDKPANGPVKLPYRLERYIADPSTLPDRLKAA
jgi:hypothetical protein